MNIAIIIILLILEIALPIWGVVWLVKKDKREE